MARTPAVAQGREAFARQKWRETYELLSAAERIWWSLQPEDWFEALAAHPRIGETAARARVSEISRGWSIGEQETVAASDAEARQRLAASIQAYEQRFGWLYLVSATGRSAADLLDAVHRLEKLLIPASGARRPRGGGVADPTELL